MMDVDISYLDKFEFNSLYFEITSRCNAKCSYCYNNSTSVGSDIPYKKIIDVMRQAYMINSKTDFVLSGGEPLLHPNIIDIIDFACNNNSDITLISNAYLLKKMSIHDVLSRCNIQVTLDSLNRIQHDNIRGKGSFDNIQNLQNIIPNYYNKNRILRINLTRDNTSYINEFCKFAINNRYTILSFGFIVNQGRGYENPLFVDYDIEDDKKIWREVIHTIKECSETYKNEIVIQRKNCYPKTGCDLLNNKKPAMSLRIASNGNAFSCLYFNHEKHSLGNIFDNSLIEILKGQRFLDLINLLLYRENNIERCKQCIWNKQCFKGCPALAFSKYNSFENEISCSFLKESFDKAVKSKAEFIRLKNK